MREYVDEVESGRLVDRPHFREMIGKRTKPNAPFKVSREWRFGGFIREPEHVLAIETCATTLEIDRATYVNLRGLTSSRRTSNSGDRPRVRNPAFCPDLSLGSLR